MPTHLKPDLLLSHMVLSTLSFQLREGVGASWPLKAEHALRVLRSLPDGAGWSSTASARKNKSGDTENGDPSDHCAFIARDSAREGVGGARVDAAATGMI